MSFVDDEENPGTKSIKTTDMMIAKDRETLAFHPDQPTFTMEGEVENYLNQLTEMMIITLKLHMRNAVDTAALWDVPGEKPRHEWLFDLSCQNALTTTQIFWTQETNAALEELEMGNEVGPRHRRTAHTHTRTQDPCLLAKHSLPMNQTPFRPPLDVRPHPQPRTQPTSLRTR